jgi:surface antigen
MNEIIRGTKEQNLISLTHQQTVLGDQIKSLFTGVEQMKEAVFGRQGTIELELNDQRQKMLDLEQATLKHATTVNETLENEIGRFERVISAFEKYIDTHTGDLRMLIGR